VGGTPLLAVLGATEVEHVGRGGDDVGVVCRRVFQQSNDAAAYELIQVRGRFVCQEQGGDAGPSHEGGREARRGRAGRA
jgi:hypothetical protein